MGAFMSGRHNTLNGEFAIDFDELQERSRQSIGVCLDCGEESTYPVEPDARGYECESCGEPSVYGAEELLFMDVAIN